MRIEINRGNIFTSIELRKFRFIYHLERLNSLHQVMQLRLLLLCCMLFVLKVTQAQNTALEMELQRAQFAFEGKKYNTASILYTKLYSKVKDEESQNKVLFMIAESYRKANNFKKAFDWYEKLVNTKYPDPKILYSYGLLLKNYERYEDASRQFSDYLFESPNDAAAKRELQSCTIAGQWKGTPLKYDIKNVSVLNTSYSDYAPYYVNGKLVWTSSRQEATGNEIFEWTGQKCSDMFEASQVGNDWSKPKNLKGGVTTNYNEGVAWFDSTGMTVYYTLCNGTDGKDANCKIYESHFQNNAWSYPKVLPFCSDSFSTGHPSMNITGTRMYFASNMPGGYGEKDIYYIEHNPVTETWGKPVNLGAGVNTPEDDMFPMLDDSMNLYYATKGKPGMGGLDLFKTKEVNKVYQEAENLKYPINSGGDDFGISFVRGVTRQSGQPFAYYTSNREGGQGDDDIYSISVKPFLFMVKGKVYDKSTNAPLAGAKVKLSGGKDYFTITTNAEGVYSGEVPLNMLLELSAGKTGYFKHVDSISSKGLSSDSTLVLNMYLDPVPPEDVEIVLQGIYYDLDKYDLRPRSKEILDSLVIILNRNPELNIELASHTDSRAPADYNLKLSQKRAQTCVDYLTTHGISKNRLVAVGYGETRLVNDCADGVECSEEEHQQNRRTTVRVLKKN